LMSNPPAPTPFSQNFTEAAMLEPSSSTPNIPPATLPPQPSIGQLPGMGYVANATGLQLIDNINYTPAQQSCKGGILESACPSVRPSSCPSVFSSTIRSIWRAVLLASASASRF
jgi:hypothetical protein